MVLAFYILLIGIPEFHTWKYVLSGKVARWIYCCITLPVILFIFFGGKLSELIQTSECYFYIHLILGICVCLYIPRFLFSLTALAFRFVKSRRRKVIDTLAFSFGLLFSALIVWGYFYGRRNFQLREIDIPIENLPESFDGVRILHISDLHLGSWLEKEDDIHLLMDFIKSADADLMICTGDIVNNYSSEIIAFDSYLARLEYPLGKYYVYGNHDYIVYGGLSEELQEQNHRELSAHIKADGFRILENEHLWIRNAAGDSLLLAAIGNYDHKDEEKQFSKLDNTLAPISDEDNIILASHNPRIFKDSISYYPNVRLVLSGHTHAYQIGIPFGKIILTPFAIGQKYWDGYYRNEQGQQLYVSRGLGEVLASRFGAWPEATVITLRRE